MFKVAAMEAHVSEGWTQYRAQGGGKVLVNNQFSLSSCADNGIFTLRYWSQYCRIGFGDSKP